MAMRYLFGLGLVAGLALCAGPSRGQDKGQKDEDRYDVVNGFAVHGYAGGKEIGYEWFRTRDQAEAERAKMLRVETETGKYYDDVQIQPEKRRFLKSNGSGTAKNPWAPAGVPPAGPRPGDSKPGVSKADPKDAAEKKNAGGSSAQSTADKPNPWSGSGTAKGSSQVSPGGRAIAPAAGSKFEVAVELKKDGWVVKVTKVFDTYADALKYMHQQNTNPDVRATMRTIEPKGEPAPDVIRKAAGEGPFVLQMRMTNEDGSWGSWYNSYNVASPYNDGQFNKELYAKKSYSTLDEAKVAQKQQDMHRRAEAAIINSYPFELRVVDATGKVVN